VIGEYERAFSGRQAQLIVPQLQSYRIAVWLPDADGPVNLADSAHQALIMLKGRDLLGGRHADHVVIDATPGWKASCIRMTDLHVPVVQAAERSTTGRRRRLTFETAGGV
jgi:hypothetical protein